MISTRFWAWWLFPFLWAPYVFAQDKTGVDLGDLRLSRFLLEPTFALREPGVTDLATSETRRSGFGIQQYQVGIVWQNETPVSGHVMLGSLQNLNRSREVTGVPPTGAGVFEAYAEHRFPVGKVRVGLIPIFFGLEGQLYESELDFPRSLFFQSRYMPLRDYGVSYSLRHENFHWQFSAHNGESAEDLDGRQALTGLWGWTGAAGLHAGVSAHVSRPVNVTTGRDVRIRYGNAYLGFQVHGAGIWVESTLGDRKETIGNADQVTSISHFRIDGQTRLWRDIGIQARYDELDPNRDVSGDQLREIMVGLNWHNTTATHHFYLLGIKRIEESGERLNDEIRLVWRICSAQSRFPAMADRFE